jgi:hypothetical protein
MNTRPSLGIAFLCAFTVLACGAAHEEAPASDEVASVGAADVELTSFSLKENRKTCGPSFNKPCGNCGGRFLCNGTCSVQDPVAHPSCTFCGGVAACNGAGCVQPGCKGPLSKCTILYPPGAGEPCGEGGVGILQCNGTCFIQ